MKIAAFDHRELRDPFCRSYKESKTAPIKIFTTQKISLSAHKAAAQRTIGALDIPLGMASKKRYSI